MAEQTDAGEMPTLPWRKPRKPTPPKRPLGQELIVETAIGILDEEGLEGVSMRRVAQELGTGPASLYAHVSNKDELLELMLDRITGEIELPEELDPARWQEQVREIAHNAQRVWTAHADIARVALASVPTGPNQLRVTETILALMRGGGVPDQAAAWAVDRLALLLTADAIEASIYHAKQRQGESFDEYMEGLTDYFRRLPAERFPNLTAMVDEFRTGDGDQRFEFGLDIFVRGLASYVADWHAAGTHPAEDHPAGGPYAGA